MSVQVKAIYENGVFRPLESVNLPERQEVTVTIDTKGHGGQHEADEDIRAGCVKRFDDPDEMIASLKKPW